MEKSPKPLEKAEFPMRINKYLALHKYSTRRGADKLIEAKQVYINGKWAKLGDKVEKNDHVEVKLRNGPMQYTYLAFNKPKGVVTHSAKENEEEILDLVPIKGIFPIGRLDKDSHGLIILTNDGRITERLLGPTFQHEKEYVVSTKETLRTSFKEKMEAGVKIDDEKTAPCTVKIINDHTFRVTLTEGKKHQIRRMCVALFQEVSDLQRVRIMNIRIGRLGQGQYREIEGEELETFLKALELA
ncbi:MAG: pseudouridine synthase [Patescibacteria group bacterium]